uniref:Uncharacterized protein n=1 Tax=Siphoviridae sp. ctNDP2 TaxID=2826265 RepID=A0A8S5NE87_9CAUD|nr:MAG TPA: hypothetical protein [Siphoviridae sp. ctNDP2]
MLPFSLALLCCKNPDSGLHIPLTRRGRQAASGVGQWGVLMLKQVFFFCSARLKPR